MARLGPISGARALEVQKLIVLHVDKDFELIAGFTGQPLERLAL